MTVVARTRAELAEFRSTAIERSGSSVAVVMTMGALHAGHAELIRQARERADVVIVTDFLNPLQFAPGEDLDKYPRTFAADLTLCESEQVDVLFAPMPDVIYPVGEPLVRVAAGPIGDVLEGDSRPGHFDGVLTVVAKLLHLTSPRLAYFGQKDAQQLWLIQQMVTDLDFGVEIVAVPTVRADDGLALSSRNTYLSSADRLAACSLYRSLVAGAGAAVAGPVAVLEAARRSLDQEPDVKVDYLRLVDPRTFSAVSNDHVDDALLVVAAFVGSTRLIDNMRLTIGADERES